MTGPTLSIASKNPAVEKTAAAMMAGTISLSGHCPDSGSRLRLLLLSDKAHLIPSQSALPGTQARRRALLH